MSGRPRRDAPNTVPSRRPCDADGFHRSAQRNGPCPAHDAADGSEAERRSHHDGRHGLRRLASYGATDVRTPNIDRLAREGVRLTDAYANGQVCSPTRAALISGRYPQRFGIERALTNALADSAIGLPVTGTSLPALLKHNGYATGLVGKWHLGFRRDFSPLAHGFDEFFGFLAGAHDYYLGDVFHDTTRVDEERRAGRQLPPLPGDTLPVMRPTYVRMLERADDGVGKILAALEKLGLSTRHIPSGWNGHSTRAARSGEWRGPSGVLACAPTGSPDVGSQIRTLEARHRGRLGPPF